MVEVGNGHDYNQEVFLGRFWKIAVGLKHFVQNPPKSREVLWLSFLKTIRKVEVDQNARGLFEKRWPGTAIEFWGSSIGVGLVMVDGMIRSFIPSTLLTKPPKYTPQLARAVDNGEIARTGRVRLTDLQLQAEGLGTFSDDGHLKEEAMLRIAKAPGILTPNLYQRMEKHLRDCKQCSQLWNEYYIEHLA